MRLRLDYPLILLILLLGCNSAFAAVYLRPCAGTKVPISSGLCSPTDQWDSAQALYYDPGDMPAYVAASGLVSTSDHTHEITSRSAGAVADGTWHSLASQGYYVATAQVRWPYLTSTGLKTGTHLIQTVEDLSNYGIDAVALQSAINEAAATRRSVLVSAYSGAHMIERGLTAPAGGPLVIAGEYAATGTDAGSTIRPHQSVMSTATPLITGAASTPIEVYRVRFAANRVASLPQYTAIKAPTGLHLSLHDCVFEGIAQGMWVTAPSWYVTAYNNKQISSGDLVFCDVSQAGGSSNYHGFVNVRDNIAEYPSMEPGSGYILRFADGVAPAADITFTGNRGHQIKAGIYINDTTSTVAGNFGTVSNNRIIINKNGGAASPLHIICAMYYEIAVQNNRVYEGQGNEGRIVLGGQGQMIVTGNQADHSNGPMLRLAALPVSLLFANNLNADAALSKTSQISISSTLIGAVYYGFISQGTVSITLGPNNQHARGQILPDAITDTARVNILNSPPVTVFDVFSPNKPGLDVSEVIQSSAGDLVLWASGTTMAYKTMRVWNKSAAQINVTNPGGPLRDLAGNTVPSLPVAAGAYIDVQHYSYTWSQIP